MISTPFYSSYQIFQELQAWRRFHPEELTFSDCFTLSIAKCRPATRLFRASVIGFFRSVPRSGSGFFAPSLL
jgi:hypothetical protein